MSAETEQSYSNAINFDEVKKGLDSKSIILVDVRNPEELQNDGKIEGSFNVPLPQFEEAFKTLKEDEFENKYGFSRPSKEDERLAITCRSGRRVKLAWGHLEPLGYVKAKLYLGSLIDWKSNNGPVITTEGSK